MSLAPIKRPTRALHKIRLRVPHLCIVSVFRNATRKPSQATSFGSYAYVVKQMWLPKSFHDESLVDFVHVYVS